jgi:hypothetical protein
MKITRHSRITASRHQLSSSLDHATIIAGSRIWQLVQTPIAAADVQRAIATEYEVAPERCEADVLALLARMADERLIEIANA